MNFANAEPHEQERKMDVPAHSADEIKQLRRCVNDLVSIMALPVIWSGGTTSQMVRTLTDVLMDMLHLDLLYVRLENLTEDMPFEMVRFAQSQNPMAGPQEIGRQLHQCLGQDSQKWPSSVRGCIGGDEVSMAPLRLGLQGEIGLIVAGVRRQDFPRQTESLLLSVAANQLVIGLHEAWLLNEQRRVASGLDQRVAHRTKELAETNEQLKREVAERKRAEEQLRRSEAFLATGQQLSRTGSFYWQMETGEITWSEELYRIFEFDPSTPVTLERIASRVPPEELPMLNDMIERAQRAASDFEYEHRLLMPDHTIKYVHLTAHADRDPQGRLVYIGAAQDITRRRLAEEALGKVRSELAHAARVTSLGELTASIAHEVNQPLAAVVTNANACLRWLNRGTPNLDEVREAVQRIVRDGNRGSEVIGHIRALLKNEHPSRTWINLNEMVGETVNLAQFELSGTDMLMKLADGLPNVPADRVQLQQVLLNLMLNAIDAMKSVLDRPRVLLLETRRHGANAVLVAVRDSGVGLKPDCMEQLFKTFYTTKPKGLGMGLSISRSIVESHGGQLWAEPNDGPGATFLFTLPVENEVIV